MHTKSRGELRELLNKYYASRALSDRGWQFTLRMPTKSNDLGPAFTRSLANAAEPLEAQLKAETASALALLAAIPQGGPAALSASLEATLNVLSAEAVWLGRLAQLDAEPTRGSDMGGPSSGPDMPEDADYYENVEVLRVQPDVTLDHSKFLAQASLRDSLQWLEERPAGSISSFLDEGFQAAWSTLVAWLAAHSGEDGEALATQLSQHTLPLLGARLSAWVSVVFVEAVRTLLKLCRLDDSALHTVLKEIKKKALAATAGSFIDMVLQVAPTRDLLQQKINSWTDPDDAATRAERIQTLYADLNSHEIKLKRISAPMTWLAKALQPILPGVPVQLLPDGLVATVYLSIAVLYAEPSWFLARSPTHCGVHSAIARDVAS